MYFLEYLQRNLSVSKEDVERLKPYLTEKKYEKGSYLLREGEVCEYIFYVNHGLVKMYAIDEYGKEHIIQFAPEAWFISDRASIYKKEKSKYFIEALEDSSIMLISEQFIAKALEISAEYRSHNEHLLQNHILQLQNRIHLLLCASLEQRYLSFMELYPELILKVPQWMIASYLGVAPESLSRIRKELKNKGQS